MGVMAIKGKILNVRKSEQKAVKKNDEINNLISAWGLDYNRTYDNEADLNTLRYGKLMIMADQDTHSITPHLNCSKSKLI